MKRETVYNFVVANIKQGETTDTIKTRLAKHLEHVPVDKLLEWKHSGDLDNRADAIIRIVTGKLYHEKA